jgi:hypothetical protein
MISYAQAAGKKVSYGDLSCTTWSGYVGKHVDRLVNLQHGRVTQQPLSNAARSRGLQNRVVQVVLHPLRACVHPDRILRANHSDRNTEDTETNRSHHRAPLFAPVNYSRVPSTLRRALLHPGRPM